MLIDCFGADQRVSFRISDCCIWIYVTYLSRYVGRQIDAYAVEGNVEQTHESRLMIKCLPVLVPQIDFIRNQPCEIEISGAI